MEDLQDFIDAIIYAYNKGFDDALENPEVETLYLFKEDPEGGGYDYS